MSHPVSNAQDAPVVTETPTISQLEERHRDALLALAYTTHSVSRNNTTLKNAPDEALQLIDELAAEVGEARLKLDRLREETRRLAESAVDLCPACGEPAGKHNVGFVPTIIQCQSRGPRR
jgi:RNA polymerase-binding transcription factor DksA